MSAAALSQSRTAPARAVTRQEAGPLRFVGIYTPHGAARELFTPGAAFDLRYENSILAPFDDAQTYGTSFKDKLLVVDNVDLTAGLEVGTTGHDASRVIFTGSGAHGKNPSIDQYLAVERGLGSDTPHTSLVLGVGNPQSDIGQNVSYFAGGTPVPKQIDPQKLFDELFGRPLTGKAALELEKERQRGLSVLDFLRHDLQGLRSRAPRTESVKLEQHETALREIEKRLSKTTKHCEAPVARSKTSFPRLKAHGGGEPFFDEITNLHVDLLARALACDLTRFSTLFLADLSRSGLFAELPADVHGDVAHRYHARSENNPGRPQTWEKLAIQNRYSYGKVARLLQRLTEAGILDDCIIYVSSDMGDPARHSSKRVPTLLLGGAKGQFKMGRYLELDAEGGTPNNRILVSICQAFGEKTERFGTSRSPAVLSGRLEELYG